MKYKHKHGKQRIEIDHRFKHPKWLPRITELNTTEIDAQAIVQKILQTDDCQWDAQNINANSIFICLQYIKRMDGVANIYYHFHRILFCNVRNFSIALQILYLATWSGWSEWGECNQPCGGGEKYATRTCKYGKAGKNECGEQAGKRKSCNTDSCKSQFSPKMMYFIFLFFRCYI